MAYYQDLVEIRRCVPSVCFPWVCPSVCVCVNVSDRCARCRAHFSQREEHQAIYTRSSGGALKLALCQLWNIMLMKGLWKVYEHNTEIIGDSHVRNTSRFHTKPRDPMLCPGGIWRPWRSRGVFEQTTGLIWCVMTGCCGPHELRYLRCPKVRYAVIYHNGGIYMDTDFLVLEARIEENRWELWVNGSYMAHLRYGRCTSVQIITSLSKGLGSCDWCAELGLGVVRGICKTRTGVMCIVAVRY